MKSLTNKRHQIVRSMLHTHNLDIGSGNVPITNESLYADVLINGIRSTSLPYPDDSFDSVTALELFEHLNDYEQIQTLKEINRVLKKDGQLIVSIPNSTQFMLPLQQLSWFIRERTTQSMYYHNNLIHGHINLQSPKQIVQRIRNFGFIIYERQRVMLYDYIIRAIKN